MATARHRRIQVGPMFRKVEVSNNVADKFLSDHYEHFRATRKTSKRPDPQLVELEQLQHASKLDQTQAQRAALRQMRLDTQLKIKVNIDQERLRQEDELQNKNEQYLAQLSQGAGKIHEVLMAEGVPEDPKRAARRKFERQASTIGGRPKPSRLSLSVDPPEPVGARERCLQSEELARHAFEKYIVLLSRAATRKPIDKAFGLSVLEDINTQFTEYQDIRSTKILGKVQKDELIADLRNTISGHMDSKLKQLREEVATKDKNGRDLKQDPGQQIEGANLDSDIDSKSNPSDRSAQNPGLLLGKGITGGNQKLDQAGEQAGFRIRPKGLAAVKAVEVLTTGILDLLIADPQSVRFQQEHLEQLNAYHLCEQGTAIKEENLKLGELDHEQLETPENQGQTALVALDARAQQARRDDRIVELIQEAAQQKRAEEIALKGRRHRAVSGGGTGAGGAFYTEGTQFRNKLIKEVVNARNKRRLEIQEITREGAVKVERTGTSGSMAKRTSVSKHENGKLKEELEQQFRKHLKEQNWCMTSEDSEATQYDKFGRKVDRVLEGYKQQMLRPRNLVKGRISNGEMRAYEQLKRMRGGVVPYADDESLNGHLVPMDSLIESCFNSEENDVWAEYRLSVRNPAVSECSEEQFSELGKDSLLDESETQDAFSAFADSEGSRLSKGYSSVASSQLNYLEDMERFRLAGRMPGEQPGGPKYRPEYYQKFCFYRLFNGLKLPMLQGEGGTKFSISDLIQVSTAQMHLQRQKSKTKLNPTLISGILSIYQKELGAAQLDLMQHMTVSSHLMFSNYRLSAPQLNVLAATMPYISDLKYINLHGVGMVDEQAGYILTACRGLPKLSELHLGGNTLGPRAVAGLRHDSLSHKIQVVTLHKLMTTHFLHPILAELGSYSVLRELDISGNRLSNGGAIALGELLTKSTILERLNLSETITSAEPGRKVFGALLANHSVKFLNLAGCLLGNIDKEFGSRIGRLLQISLSLTHLDIRYCKLSREEILYITLCVRESLSLMSIHLGYNTIDGQCRLLARRLLAASVKLPFRSAGQVHKFLTTSEDKNLVLTLNSFVLGGLPNIPGTAAAPLTSQEEAQDKIDRLFVSKEGAGTLADDPLLKRLEQLRAVTPAARSLGSLIGQELKQKVVAGTAEQYFQPNGVRTYDMVNFLDYYGRKYRYLHVDNPRSSYAELLGQLNLKFGATDERDFRNYSREPSLIKMREHVKLQDWDKEAEPMTLQDVIELRRAAAHSSDIKKMLSNKPIVNESVLEEIKTFHAWACIYNDLDVMLQNGIAQRNPSTELKTDLVFERVLGHPQVTGLEGWRETSDCWICNCHNVLEVQVNDFTCLRDAEYTELLSLSAVVNEERLMNLDQKAEVPELMPIYKEVFTNAEGADQKSKGNADPPDSNTRIALGVTSPTVQKAGLSSHHPGVTSEENQPSEVPTPELNNIDFTKYNDCTSLFPVSKQGNQAQEVASGAKNVVIFSQNIQASPLTSKKMKQFLQPLTCDQQKIEQYNNLVEPIQQLKSKQGFVYKDLHLRHDWLDFEDSSENEDLDAILMRSHKEKAPRDPRRKSRSRGADTSKSSHKSRGGALKKHEHAARPQTQHHGPTGRRPRAQQPSHGLEERTEAFMTINPSLAQQPSIGASEGAEGQQVKQTLLKKVSKSQAQVGHALRTVSRPSTDGMGRAKSIEHATGTHTVASSKQADVSVNVIKVKDLFDRPAGRPDRSGTESRSKTGQSESFISYSKSIHGAKDALRKEQCDPEELVSLDVIKQNVKIQQLNILQRQKTFFDANEEQKKKLKDQVTHGKKWQYAKNAVERLPNSHPVSAVDALVEQVSQGWHKLKQADPEAGEECCYFVSSFNHWFPVKMKKIEETYDQAEVQVSKNKKKVIHKGTYSFDSHQFSQSESEFEESENSEEAEESIELYDTEARGDKGVILQGVVRQTVLVGMKMTAKVARKTKEMNEELRLFDGVEKRKNMQRLATSYVARDVAKRYKGKTLVDPRELKNLFQFKSLVPPGKHYFYIVLNGNKYSLSKKFDVSRYPGTNLKMNIVTIEPRSLDIHHYHPDQHSLGEHEIKYKIDVE